MNCRTQKLQNQGLLNSTQVRCAIPMSSHISDLGYWLHYRHPRPPPQFIILVSVQYVRLVNDYANTVSALLTTMLTPYPPCQ